MAERARDLLFWCGINVHFSSSVQKLIPEGIPYGSSGLEPPQSTLSVSVGGDRAFGLLPGEGRSQAGFQNTQVPRKSLSGPQEKLAGRGTYSTGTHILGTELTYLCLLFLSQRASLFSFYRGLQMVVFPGKPHNLPALFNVLFISHFLSFFLFG